MANIFYFVCVINYTRLSYVDVCGITMDYCSNREHYNMKLYIHLKNPLALKMVDQRSLSL